MKKVSNYRLLLILGTMMFLIVAVGVVIMSFLDERNKNQEQSMPNDDIYARIPWRFGAVDQDPHWNTSFDALDLQGLQDFSFLPAADPTLDPWGNNTPGVRSIFLVPGDLSGRWSVTVGHGFVKVRNGEAQALYYDTIDLEAQLLRQGITHGFLEDMQQIYPERDFSEYLQ